MAGYRYPLSNEWIGARERLSLLETMRDPWTIRTLERIGIKKGWRCLEIAGGGGSIAQWLCDHVGSNGHVVATDLEPHFLEAIDAPNLEVWRHNVIQDLLPEASFDLVHARSVLTFLPHPTETIINIVSAVKPGGWILLEEPDYISEIADPSMTPHTRALSEKVHGVLLALMESLGYHTDFGRRLYHELLRNGISEIQAEGLVTMRVGGMPSARFFKVTLEQLRDRILTDGLLTLAELEEYCFLLESPEYRWLNQMIMSVWGRRTM